jgi:hypothetical protein
MSFDPASSRAPFAKGGYESYYLVAHHPSAPQAVWIRYTVHQEPGGEPGCLLWLTVFDAPRGPAWARRETRPPSPRDGAWLRVGDAAIDGVSATGALADASWDLRIEPLEPMLAYLPSERMYRGPLPRTKPISLAPRARFHGSLHAEGRTIAVEGWEGMLGHNWGSEHANRWIWLHGIFDEGAWIDLVAARIKAGPVLTPWLANGAVSFDGARHRLGGLGRTRAVRIDAHQTSATMLMPGDGVTVHATVRAPDPVRWDYADPRGGAHEVVNCSIASLELEVRHRDATRRLRTEHAASYELGVPATT